MNEEKKGANSDYKDERIFLISVSARLKICETREICVNLRFGVFLSDDTIRPAEIHWYEASGIGRKRMKIKRFLD